MDQESTGIKNKYEMEIPVTWVPFIDRLKKREKTRTITFEFVKSVNMERMAKAIDDLPMELIGENATAATLPHITTNINKIIYVVGCGIQNNHLEPKPSLLRFIKNNFDHQDLLYAFNLCIQQMGLESFIGCIIILRGISKILNPEQEEGFSGVSSDTVKEVA